VDLTSRQKRLQAIVLPKTQSNACLKTAWTEQICPFVPGADERERSNIVRFNIGDNYIDTNVLSRRPAVKQ
jgi:hypothetical protein